MTNKQIEIENKLHSLVHRIFDLDSLKKELSKILGVNIILCADGHKIKYTDCYIDDLYFRIYIYTTDYVYKGRLNDLNIMGIKCKWFN